MSAGRYPAHVALEAAQLFAANLAYCCERIALAGSLRRWVSAGYQPADRTVGDIEIVAIPRFETRKEQTDLFSSRELAVNLLWERCELLQGVERAPAWKDDPRKLANEAWQALYWPWVARDKNGALRPKWGEKFRKLAIPTPGDTDLLPCDLFTATAENWGYILAERTGPHELNMIWVVPPEKGGMRPAGVEMRQGTVYVDGEPVATPTEESFFEIVGLPYLAPHERETYKPERRAA